MKICSITLTSRTRENIIGDALWSVNWCDLNLVAHLIDEPGDDMTLEAAQEVAGPRYVGGEVRLLKNIAQARTWALDWAASTGCDWAVQVDTDDRIRLNGFDIRGYLESLPEEVHALTVQCSDGEGDRALFFRLPAKGVFQGVVHEEYSLPVLWLCPTVRLECLPKSPDVLKTRLQGDLKGLTKQWEEDPNNPRWPYYIGVTREQLEDIRGAALAYQVASFDYRKTGDMGMAAWCAFREAFCDFRLDDPDEALKISLKAMGLCPSMPEIQVLAAMVELKRERVDNAEAWALMALAHNWARRLPADLRLGPKALGGHFESPFLILATVYEAQGKQSDHAWACGEAEKAEAARLKFQKTGAIV